MKLEFLGSGAAFNPIMENSNAYFLAGKRFFLLDCGETAFGRIWNLPAYTESEEVVALITHLHADHVGSLGSLISYSYYVMGKPVTVAHPLETIVRLLDLLGIDRACYRFRKLGRSEAEDLGGGVSAKALLVDHVPNMTCFGYLVSDGAESVYFSGDAKSLPAEVLEGLESGEIDRAYQDTSNTPSDHPAHATLSYLESIIPERLRGKVYCIHLDYDYRDLLIRKGFRVVNIAF
jgi:Cft2 family RNA processing exonuclease